MNIHDLEWQKHPLDPRGFICNFYTNTSYVSIARTRWTCGDYSVFIRKYGAADKHTGETLYVDNLEAFMSASFHAVDDFAMLTGRAA